MRLRPRHVAAATMAGVALWGARDAWQAWRRRQEVIGAGAGRGLPAGRVQRTAKLARASAVTARELAVSKARQVGKSEPERAALEERFHLRTAEQVMGLMGEMKGALMKIGQMVSFIDSGLPEPYRQALASLQADAPPMAYSLVSEVVTAELGRPPERIFADFSHEPIAAASIGQVHAARLPDGTDVVVKVQYPGVDEAIRSDLDNADLLYTMFRAVYPNLEPKPIVDELRERIGEELDYTAEIANQQAFLDIYRGHPFIHIPEVFPEHSSRRVLTMERAAGRRWKDALDAPRDLRNQWAEAIFRYVFRTLNWWHIFNGDPHPGNYLFHDDGTVTFLDFGCVKRFDPEHLNFQREMLLAEIDGDAEAMRKYLVHFGFIRPDDDLDPQRYVDWFRQWDQPLLVEEFTYTPEFAEAAVRANYDPMSEWGDVARRMNLPKEFVFLTRINLGLNSILAGLHASNRWRAMGDEWWFDGPPATPMGEAEAAFFAGRP